jgi:hypothetical protein
MFRRTFTLRKNLVKKSKDIGLYQIVARQKYYRMDDDRLDRKRIYEEFWGFNSRGLGEKPRVGGLLPLRKNLAKKWTDSGTYHIVARQKCYRMNDERVIQG